jgi:hypothetical protein
LAKYGCDARAISPNTVAAARLDRERPKVTGAPVPNLTANAPMSAVADSQLRTLPASLGAIISGRLKGRRQHDRDQRGLKILNLCN